MTTDDATEVLTLRVAGERFGLSPSTLRDMAQRGQLARAHKRPCPGGEEWVVPVLTVEAIAIARGVGRNGSHPDAPAPPVPYAIDPRPRRRARRSLPSGVVRTVLLALLAVAAVVGVLAATGDDPGATGSSGTLDANRSLVAEALAEHLPAGDPVGVLGATAPDLVQDRSLVVLPAAAVPPVVVLAGAVPSADQELAAQIMDQGTLILSLSGGAEVWALPDAFDAPQATAPPTTVARAAPPSTTPDPPAAPEPPAPPAPPPPAAPTPPASPADGTAVVVAGQGFWDVAAGALADQLGRAATDAEVLPYWQALIDVNQDRLPDPGNPDLVYSGTVLELPAP